jgi:putative transcriptional regulator
MKKELFEELLESVNQAKSIKHRELKPSRVFSVNPHSSVVRVRGKLGISQDTLQNWEQGRHSPTGPAKVLLKIATKHPEVLLEVA